MPRLVFITHPDNFELLPIVGPDAERMHTLLCGLPIEADDRIPRYREKFIPPRESLIEYEPSDEPWLRYFGFGKVRRELSIMLVTLPDPMP